MAAFEGRVLSYVNSEAAELELNFPVAFGEVGNVATAIAGNGRRRLRRQGVSTIPMQGGRFDGIVRSWTAYQPQSPHNAERLAAASTARR